MKKKRRDFIKKSVMGTTGIVIGGMGFTAKSYGSIIGSNERINVASVGIRTQGSVHVKAWCGLKNSHNVRLKTLCDTDERLFGAQSKIVTDETGSSPLTEWDLYKVLDDKEIDAVSFAIPNHWHALATILACQAGKHVYVEKPAMHNIWEGRKMIEAARKYNRRVQVGLNNRSVQGVREAIQFMHDGGIGEVYLARGFCYKRRDSYGTAADSTPPAGFHYDRWLGPAAYQPYNEKRTHYNFHWYWNTGNGDIGNSGPHQYDIARWGLNKNEHPVAIHSNGGLFGFRTDEDSSRTPGVMVYGGVETYGHDKTFQETPNVQTCVSEYMDGKIIEFEVRGRYTNSEGSLNIQVGNIFYGREGYLEVNGGTWKAFHLGEDKPFAGSKDGENKRDPYAHWANFIDGIRSGNDESLHADINDGFLSSALPLLSNISYRLNRKLNFMGGDLNNERFANDSEADAMLTRTYRHPYIVTDEI